MRSSTSSPWRRIAATVAFLAASSPHCFLSAVAALSVSRPLADQYPQIAHAGQAYSWTFSPTTFTGEDNIEYSAKGLPSWAKFDEASRTFTGTPPQGNQDKSTVTITAASSGSPSSSSSFDLIVVNEQSPILRTSLADQLPMASSLGRSQILPGNKLHIPWGWSFSVGWQGDTFYLPSGDAVYTHATINHDQPLPSWLKYSPQTYAMWGIAPNVPGAEGTEFVFVLTGSNLQGKFGGTSTNISIVLGTGNLAEATSSSAAGSATALPALNATAGQEVSYTIPLSAFLVDGHPASANSINVTADTSSLPWLSYDAPTRTLKGTPPTNSDATASNTSLPLTVTNSLGKSLNAKLPVNLFPPTFSAATLPNVMVMPGQDFSVSLAEYVRDSAQHTISLALDPESASQWVHFDASSLVLSGTAPQMGSDEKVKVTLQSAASSAAAAASSSSSNNPQRRADASDSPSNSASFYIAPQGSNPGRAPAPSDGNDDGSSSGNGLSQRTKIGLAAGLGSVGAIIILILLLIFARRCCAVEEHDRHGNVIVPGKSPAFSERTLTNNDASPMWGQEADKKEKHLEKTTPQMVQANSPYEEQGKDLKGILIGGRHYGGSPAMDNAASGEDAAPRQHGFMSALVAGARKWSSRNLSQQADPQASHAQVLAHPPSQSAHRGRSDSQGLGLTGLDLDGDTPDSDDPYRGTGTAPSRSHLSMRSKESWEEDLFYSSTEAAARGVPISGHQQHQHGNALAPVIEVDEVPTRRGGSDSSMSGRGRHLRVSSRSNPMRHRSGHSKNSPSFVASDTFDTPAADEMPTNESDPYVIGTAQRVDVRTLARQGSVQSRRPDVTRGHHHSRSMHLEDPSGAFEDAEDEVGQMVGQNRENNAVSPTEPLPPSHLEALAHIQYPQAVQAHSPRPPSFFGGSSIASNIRPEDTMRAVATPPRQQHQAPRTPAGALGSPQRPTSRSGFVEHLEANVSMGERIRIKLTPPGGAAMMGGAPGSPGKRSNRRGKYVPVLDDASMQAHGTWPIWLSEWLHWDAGMFELSGEVPVDFELPELHLALVHRRQGTDVATGAMGTPGSSNGSSGSSSQQHAPSAATGHRRQGSQDSAITAVEDEVVIRLTLFIDWPVDPTGSGNHIALRRGEAAGTAF